jgi:thaumarchaeosortase
MKLRLHIEQELRKLSEIRKGRLHFLLMSFFFVTILLILFLDFFNIEAFDSFNQKFMFDLTWKGRMFYLFFIWLFLLESILDWEVIVEKQRTFQNRFRVLILFIIVVVPSVYILGVNFFGLNQTILNFGRTLQIRPNPPDFINEHWPLSVEYLILVSFFMFATWLAYGRAGLKSFSISLSLLGGMGIIYLVDTVWPFGTFRPMQLLAVPTAACATALLDLLGYNVELTYPVLSSEYGAFPLMTVSAGGETVERGVAWPCAGVHSLLLFALIALVFFKKTTILRERKIIFFLIGAAGTYLTNVFRIASFFTISVHYGSKAGDVFHNSYGELYFIAWVLLFFIVVLAIQSGKINRLTQTFRKKLKVFRGMAADDAGKETQA